MCQDTTCKCHDYSKPIILDPHHIQPTSKQGPDELWNGITLCRFAHTKAEEGYNDPQKGRVSGYEYVAHILQSHIDKPLFRWGKALEWIEKRIECKNV